MVHGNFANGDYFIDSPGISQFALRAIVGVWINICVAGIAFCIRFIFRSQVKKRIWSEKCGVPLWRVAPAVTPSEAFALRGILARALKTGDFSFVFVSTFCIVASIVGAASTVISNRVVGNNTIVRDAIVQGRLVTRDFTAPSMGAMVRVSARVDALTRANAPLDELFDFVPEDDTEWIYKPSQWNNTWKGNCSFAKHEAAELELLPTKSSLYQDEVPSLRNYIPSWATVNKTNQGLSDILFYVDRETDGTGNGTGSFRDVVRTYVFGTAPAGGEVETRERNTNIVIVNFLAHHIGINETGSDTGYYLFSQTKFRSDIHIAECQFFNAVANGGTRDQAGAIRGTYSTAALHISNMYNLAVMDASIAEKNVTQPTGQEMLRYWQAFMSVKDAQYPHTVARTLSVHQHVVQIRLSFLVVTIGAFLFTIIAATLVRMTLMNGVRKVHIPSSQLDWIVQAARENVRDLAGRRETTPRDHFQPMSFVSSNQDLVFTTTTDLEPRISTTNELSDTFWSPNYSTSTLELSILLHQKG